MTACRTGHMGEKKVSKTWAVYGSVVEALVRGNLRLVDDELG